MAALSSENPKEHFNVHINILCMCFCTIPWNGHSSLSTALVILLDDACLRLFNSALQEESVSMLHANKWLPIGPYVWVISTTNLAACVCVSSKFDQFLPARFYFVSKRPENFVRIAKFPYAAFGPLFAFHCPLFVTKNNNLGWNRHASPHTEKCRFNDHGPTVLSARGQ